jgi:hypothetical protein
MTDEERPPTRAEVEAFLLQAVEMGLLEIAGVNEHGWVLYRGTGRPWPKEPPAPH